MDPQTVISSFLENDLNLESHVFQNWIKKHKKVTKHENHKSINMDNLHQLSEQEVDEWFHILT